MQADGQTSPFAKPVRSVRPDQSPLDDREYLTFSLSSNGLRVVLVRDAEADRAAACMSVGVGHLSDPPEYPGLAHFCEHMCFLGSNKYPDEGEYREFLSQHGGFANAFTATEETSFGFEVSPEHLLAALDRFAHCFLHPLFAESAVMREVMAVDSEHKMNLNSDAHRVFQLHKSLVQPAHPYSKFGTGCRETLLGDAGEEGQDEAARDAACARLRAALCTFHERYYGADNMVLCVFFTGQHSLQHMSDTVVQLFGEVRRARDPHPEAAYDQLPLYTAPESSAAASNADGVYACPLGCRFFVEPVKDVRDLQLTFPIPPQRHLYRSKPCKYLAHLIGHEAAGSLLAALKQRAWATALSAGPSHEVSGAALFEVDAALTEAGLAAVDQVVDMVYAYVQMLRRYLDGEAAEGTDLPEYIYTEMQTLGEMHFRYRDKDASAFHAAITLASSARHFAAEHLLSGPFLLYERPSHVQLAQLLACLQPEKGIHLLAVKDALSLRWSEAPKTVRRGTERWYGTEYAVETHAVPTSRVYATFADKLHLPRPNRFLPRAFDLRAPPPPAAPSDSELQPTRLVDDEPHGRVLHHCLDTRFRLPKAIAVFRWEHPLAYDTPRHAVLTKLAVAAIDDALMHTAYDAELAGLAYSIVSTATGLTVTVQGFSDSLPRFTEHVFRVAVNAVGDEDPAAVERLAADTEQRLFAANVDRLRRSFLNASLKPPYQQVVYQTRVALQQPHWHALYDYVPLLDAENGKDERDVAGDIAPVSLAEMQAFRARLFQAAPPESVCLEALLHGNVDAAEARTLYDRCAALLGLAAPDTVHGGTAVPPRRRQRCRQVQLPPAPSCTQITFSLPNPEEVNSAVGVYWQTGVCDPEEEVLLDLVSDILDKPVFHELRTVQQLGYVVSSFAYSLHGVQGWWVIVQSSTLRSPWPVAERIMQLLPQLSRERFGMVEAADGPTAVPEAHLNAESLGTYITALIDRKRERDRNLTERCMRWWSEIDRGTFVYARRERELQILEGMLHAGRARTGEAVARAEALQAVRQFWAERIRHHSGILQVLAVPPGVEAPAEIPSDTARRAWRRAADVRAWQAQMPVYPPEPEMARPTTCTRYRHPSRSDHIV